VLGEIHFLVVGSIWQLYRLLYPGSDGIIASVSPQ
jgi:hypothetical protein